MPPVADPRPPTSGSARRRRRRGAAWPAAAALGFLALVPAPAAGDRFPDVLVVCVDTLRADRLSSYGYRRPTSPAIDRLLARGVRFDAARTVEPLTGPAVASMLTGRLPHEHGATRNGLRVRPGLASLPKRLAARGYRTAAFVGNWSLRDELTGLAEHFDEYHEVLTRKQLFGLFNGEATGEDLSSAARDWIAGHREREPHRPYLVWIQYVEPHAPYRFWPELAGPLGIVAAGEPSPAERYDTEVAYIDREIGRLLYGLDGDGGALDDTLVVFAADHGESLGDHGYWGHGRHVYDDALRIPLAFVWPQRLAPAVIREPALIADVAPSVLGLVGLPVPDGWRGHDWSAAASGAAPAPRRSTFYQAHKGTVHWAHESESARLDGLLELGWLEGTRKEVLDLADGSVRIYDLATDPDERRDLARDGRRPSAALRLWRDLVVEGLRAASDIPLGTPDAETRAQLRSLGYTH